MDKDSEILIDAILAAQEELSGRISEAMRDQLPVYRTVPREALNVEVGLEVERVLRSIRAGPPAASNPQLADLSAIGEERAQQGIPVADMLRAWHIGIENTVSYAREVSQRLGIEDIRVLAFTESVLAWADAAMITTAGAHAKAELVLAQEEQCVKFVHQTLLGTAPTAQLHIQAEEYGLDPAGEYVAVRAKHGEAGSAFKLDQVLSFHVPGQPRPGLIAIVDNNIKGFLREPPVANIGGIVGVGPPRPLQSLEESYRLATRALTTAQAYGLTGAYDISSLGLRAAVAADNDIGQLLRKRYINPLEASGSAGELMETLRAYLGCGMHVERTARQLFVHQNTVRYRLARFEELTEVSLRDTKVLFEVWWALEFSAIHL